MVIFHGLPIKNGDFPWFSMLVYQRANHRTPGTAAGAALLRSARACPEMVHDDPTKKGTPLTIAKLLQIIMAIIMAIMAIMMAIMVIMAIIITRILTIE